MTTVGRRGVELERPVGYREVLREAREVRDARRSSPSAARATLRVELGEAAVRDRGCRLTTMDQRETVHLPAIDRLHLRLHLVVDHEPVVRLGRQQVLL